MADSNYVPQSQYEQRVLGWLSEAVSEGDAFLRAQTGYNKIPQAINTIMGDAEFQPRPSDLSSNTVNHFAKIALDLASGLTDTKPFWEFTTKNKKYEQQAQNFNNLSEHWWTGRYIDLRFMDAIKYSLSGGTGWCHLYYNSDIQDMDMCAEDPRDVIPIRPSSYLTIQDAMGIVLRKERTVNYLRHLYPKQASRIKADRDGSLAELEKQRRMRSFLNTESSNSSPFSQYLFGRKPALEISRVPTVDFFTCYIKDDSINENSYEVQMGDAEQNWGYTVKPGDPLYPRGRCIEFTRTVVLYDGPNPYWHGMFPFLKLTLDPWPWSWLGKGPLWDLLPIQKNLDKLLRVMDDHNQKFAAPDLIANKNSVSKKEWEKIDTRRAGLKFRTNPIQGKGIEYQYPNPLDPSISNAIKFYIEEMNTLSGVVDLTAMSKLGQIPSSETVEKIIEAMTPAVRIRSRIIEVFLREFAMMTASNIMQFVTTPEMVATLGPQSLTVDDLDFDPGTMVPDFIHASDFNESGDIKPESLLRGPLPRYDRSREFLKHMRFEIAQGSLLNASSIEKKLLYLQLSRAGLIDHWTLLETLGVKNVGDPPDGAITITQRLLQEQQLGLGMAMSTVGRKPTGQAMPSMTPTGAISESG